MDLEAVQLLNLSPIPELSELELSTMFEQLSGLSDLNGDLTDRNVEDILKEAEDLIDSSMSSKANELPTSDKIHEHDIQMQYPKVNSQNNNETQEPLSDRKNSNSPAENLTPKSSPSKTLESQKPCNSLVEQANKIFLPGESSNPIKSTIESLKELSTLVEKQLSSRSTTSPKSQNYSSDKSTEKITGAKAILKNEKQNTNLIVRKNSEQVQISKSRRLLNCFERLYQDRPNRLSKKQKVLDKTPKTGIKKKHFQQFKSQISRPTKATWNKDNSEELNSDINERISENILPKHYSEVENWLNSNPKCCPQINHVLHGSPKKIKNVLENEFHEPKNFAIDFKVDDSCKISSQINEKLILKLLQGMEEIKDHVKKTGVIKNEIPEKILQESQAVIDSLRSEVESVKEKVVLESVKNSGIERLEEQFAILKTKYEQHMKKLETENLKLKEALRESYNSQTGIAFESTKTEPPREVDKLSLPTAQMPSSTKMKIFRSFSTENCMAPRNSPCSSLEDVRSSERKEAFSQTEKDVRSMSVQCLEEPNLRFEEVTIEEDDDIRKTENKENVTEKKKPGKERLFSEKNSHQLFKQKRIVSNHESQLLATLRGLQTELTIKEKENRKLKTEIEVLKNQLKKSGKKVEGTKRRHIGTQTIGLGPIVQKPYNPEVYEVSGELERENEELKSKIKALEEDFMDLKEKRVNDLQALHLVHEEEMAKLLSKLETQSALTKHLHSLLVNR